MKKLSRNALKTIGGGFSCTCGTRYIGEFSSIASCTFACSVLIKAPWDKEVH
ncbi:hypothetical protein [Chryseobacterium sp. GVT01B]|uniref:hypothetical protein n=1 Tax=unclassified Chryseobacterium TaxID=2593645 RepID=UPI001CBBAC0F|nr:hypothetical protein [Chryseobacterium sp. GVT01B]